LFLFGSQLYSKSHPPNDSFEKALNIEFNQLQQLQTAVVVEKKSANKGTYSSVHAHYITKQSKDEIIKYYESELKKHGWKFVEKEFVKSIYGELAEERYKFIKDDKKLFLSFSQNPVEAEYTFSISLGGH